MIKENVHTKEKAQELAEKIGIKIEDPYLFIKHINKYKAYQSGMIMYCIIMILLCVVILW